MLKWEDFSREILKIKIHFVHIYNQINLLVFFAHYIIFEESIVLQENYTKKTKKNTSIYIFHFCDNT